MPLENPIYQLRIYEVKPELRSVFHRRFEQHASRIMRQDDFHILSMWESGNESHLEFVYLLALPNKAVLQQQWAAFMGDEEWQSIKIQIQESTGEPVWAKVRDSILTTVPYAPFCKVYHIFAIMIGIRWHKLKFLVMQYFLKNNPKLFLMPFISR
ncbi:NIPSNAP family protein [Snodgrassella sp. CFCC 13594]|uniref:NIPSNAP family protein n=1 Tax=Snodgrassella sp. CFCC 13594 TaxID=1775559 RepID=UPI000A5B1E3F|nr:NIPSNAP family protein [Snodgrassella sp. CFCC 13594]